jgi:dTDP-4-dehydrorhamnose 3,5-epimerase
MEQRETLLPGVLELRPRVFRDKRGFFLETYHQAKLEEIGVADRFVQDNHSRSQRNVLRGLHYQIEHPQGKLIRVVAGKVLDVAVDVRKNSATFAKYAIAELSANNKCMMWVPPGFAHGFLVLSEHAEVLYKATDYWHPEFERTLAWNDPDVKVPWPLDTTPLLSAKDRLGACLSDAELYA